MLFTGPGHSDWFTVSALLCDERACELTSRDSHKQEHFKPTTLVIVWCIENSADSSVSPLWQPIHTRVMSLRLSGNIKGKKSVFFHTIGFLIRLFCASFPSGMITFYSFTTGAFSADGCLINSELVSENIDVRGDVQHFICSKERSKWVLNKVEFLRKALLGMWAGWVLLKRWTRGVKLQEWTNSQHEHDVTASCGFSPMDVQLRSSRAAVLQVLEVSLLQHTWFRPMHQ